MKIGERHWYRNAQKEKFKDLFLIRRAYLIFLTQSYDYAVGKDVLDKWRLSIKLYSNIEIPDVEASAKAGATMFLMPHSKKNYSCDIEGVYTALDTISHLDRSLLKPIVKIYLKILG